MAKLEQDYSDEDAFTEVYNRYLGRVYGFAYRMLGARELAEEVTHEAFLVLIKHPERYDAGRGSMLTFLCSVARNCILKNFRARGLFPEDSLEDHGPVLARADDDPGPLADLLEEELAAKINESLGALPALQREVVVLREFQELSYEEIAQVVGASVGVVRARLHRGRQNLAKILAPYMNVKGDRCYELRRS